MYIMYGKIYIYRYIAVCTVCVRVRSYVFRGAACRGTGPDADSESYFIGKRCNGEH